MYLIAVIVPFAISQSTPKIYNIYLLDTADAPFNQPYQIPCIIFYSLKMSITFSASPNKAINKRQRKAQISANFSFPILMYVAIVNGWNGKFKYFLFDQC